MNTDMLAYLQKDQIGKIIAKGLANVYTNKPETPIKYLAQWLKNYSSNQKELHKLEAVEHQKIDNLKVFHSNIQIKKAQEVQQLKKKEAYDAQIHKFKETIAHHEYQEELLEEIFPEFIEKLLGLTGAYIGYLNHPVKDITEEDEDQNAHLNTSIPKLINYIGTSKSHRQIMFGKTLPLEKGVTGGAFSLSLDDSPPQIGEDGVQIPQEKKEKCVYIGNVVKNQNMHYFRLPKLGAYVAVPLIYNSHLKENIFDAALEDRIKYLTSEEQFNKAKKQQLKEIQTQKEELEKKLTQLVEKHAEEALIQTAKEEIAQNHKRKEAREQSKYVGEPEELPTEKRQFVFCGDNLGQDKEISEPERQLLIELVKHFRDSWQHKQKQLLQKDVEYQIAITKQLPKTIEEQIQHLQKCQQINAQVKATLQLIEDQNLRNYKTWEHQLQLLHQEVKENHHYEEYFLKLSHFRVVKYKELIQLILHFLKHEKSEINLPGIYLIYQGKTIINWKKVRSTHITKETFHQIVDYIVEGPKTGDYPHYCKATTLIEKLFQYNVGFGAILKFIKKALKHRISNVQLRKTQKENQRKQRQALLQENQQITEEKRVNLEKHKAALAPEQIQTFNEEEWSSKYDEEHPLKQIPAEIIDDIDNDI